ncbi:hypothetical protein Pla22_44210 [Rubripirellula amarantea]|uniref:Uncharacterized protein n=2 Tax=Rubripirellula amarantea TaxID=2527999 RepID=A0A5C5WGJ2_9BACT|nr:hypothetical protein [Rubripirellula amarantea]TWT49229.1 hypothetical protein Pla22_44210 [Rubripirellula amarantea]
MLLTHEIGHLVGGWCGGATLVDVDLAPWRMPYSIHHPDPHPRLTLWAGPLLGVIVPVGTAILVQGHKTRRQTKQQTQQPTRRQAWRKWAWLVADFCLLANGTYLAIAWVACDRFLDTPRMLAAGVSPIFIAAYCVVTVSVGYVRFRNDCVVFFSRRESSNSSEGSSIY